MRKRGTQQRFSFLAIVEATLLLILLQSVSTVYVAAQNPYSLQNTSLVTKHLINETSDEGEDLSVDKSYNNTAAENTTDSSEKCCTEDSEMTREIEKLTNDDNEILDTGYDVFKLPKDWIENAFTELETSTKPSLASDSFLNEIVDDLLSINETEIHESRNESSKDESYFTKNTTYLESLIDMSRPETNLDDLISDLEEHFNDTSEVSKDIQTTSFDDSELEKHNISQQLLNDQPPLDHESIKSSEEAIEDVVCSNTDGWNLKGSEWGCCGNYEGCCVYASLICYFHDMVCRCCDHGEKFCGPKCKPEPDCFEQGSSDNVKDDIDEIDGGLTGNTGNNDMGLMPDKHNLNVETLEKVINGSETIEESDEILDALLEDKKALFQADDPMNDAGSGETEYRPSV